MDSSYEKNCTFHRYVEHCHYCITYYEDRVIGIEASQLGNNRVTHLLYIAVTRELRRRTASSTSPETRRRSRATSRGRRAKRNQQESQYHIQYTKIIATVLNSSNHDHRTPTLHCS